MDKSLLKEGLLSIIFPKRCRFCGEVIDYRFEVCSDCAQNTGAVLPPVCLLCGENEAECTCRKHKNAYKAVISPYYYTGAAEKAVRRLKFRGKFHVGETLAEDMAQVVKREYADIVFDFLTCVPMSRKELAGRGYEQNEYICKPLSEYTGIPFEKLLDKLYDTPAQHTLKAGERAGNVLGVFAVKAGCDIQGKTVLLCDDVRTTGATLNECARTLLVGGARDVYCVTAALTRMKSNT
ncbi:MAG: ComF family protein [Clostridiales bacterium]|nr:ComF family protein [Clostridiales bacterium]